MPIGFTVGEMGVEQSTLEQYHLGLSAKWARGTNTSVFLSLYRRNGEAYLLNKGDQMRLGFVPMLETWDTGIDHPGGVNWYAISGTSSITPTNALYCNHTAPYDQAATLRIAEEKAVELLGEPKDQRVVGILRSGPYVMVNAARALQYDPSAQLGSHVLPALESFIGAMEDTIGNMNLIVTLATPSCRAAAERAGKVDPFEGQFAYEPLRGSRAAMEFIQHFDEWFTDARKMLEYDNKMRAFLRAPGRATEEGYQSISNYRESTLSILRNWMGGYDGYSNPISAVGGRSRGGVGTPEQAVSSAIWLEVARMAGRQLFSAAFIDDPSAMLDMRHWCTDRYFVQMALIQRIIDTATHRGSPTSDRYLPTLTDYDKEILAHPVPLILASTGTEADHLAKEDAMRGQVILGKPRSGDQPFVDMIIFPSIGARNRALTMLRATGFHPTTTMHLYHVSQRDEEQFDIRAFQL